jgi:hypothetical protein
VKRSLSSKCCHLMTIRLRLYSFSSAECAIWMPVSERALPLLLPTDCRTSQASLALPWMPLMSPRRSHF